MKQETMSLRILLPSGPFAEWIGVARIVAEARAGSFGILPHRLDCVAPLPAGILTHATLEGVESYTAIDQGVLLKTGLEVVVSTRRAMVGVDLGKLRAALEDEFFRHEERERDLRAVLARMESGFIRRFVESRHG